MMGVLIVVDAQYDFMPGGALAVAEGDQIIPVIKKIADKFDYIVYTKDWHPEYHCSFKEQGGPWPIHCVQDTYGAKIHEDLIPLFNRKPGCFILKGVDTGVDHYSGFWDNEKKHETALAGYLRSQKIRDIYICGLATDVCVKFTALDGIEEGFNVTLVEDACRGVNVNPDDVERAVMEMKNAGIHFIKSNNL